VKSFAELVPEGTKPPSDIPAPIFEAAHATYLGRRRLDMQALAAEVGISRATLYRRVGDRDRLLGAVLWYEIRHSVKRAFDFAERRRGARRVIAILDRFMRDVHGQPALHHLLDAEPEASLRILTTRKGPVQGGVIEIVRQLLEEEHAAGNLTFQLHPSTLAYVIVRVIESFLYADVIGAAEPDIGQAVDVLTQLLREA